MPSRRVGCHAPRTLQNNKKRPGGIERTIKSPAIPTSQLQIWSEKAWVTQSFYDDDNLPAAELTSSDAGDSRQFFFSPFYYFLS
jgi:hypothetical protein